MMMTMGTVFWMETKTMTAMELRTTLTQMTTAMEFPIMTTSRESFEDQETEFDLFEWDSNYKYKCPRVMFQRPVSRNGSDRSVDLHISRPPHKRGNGRIIGGQRWKSGDGWDDQTRERVLGLLEVHEVLCLCLVNAHPKPWFWSSLPDARIQFQLSRSVWPLLCWW